jgi:hypothetical protein
MAEARGLAAHQPAYLPWLGYFERIARVEMFVFLDTVQFEKNSFINRNRIKTPQGAQWLTIPVRTRGHLDGTLRDTQIDNSKNWRADHLKAISLNYRKAPQFAERFGKLEALYAQYEDNLAELCWQQLQFWLAELGITTRLVRASDLALSSRKSELVLDICRSLAAEHYLSGALGRDYLDEAAFAAAGIEVSYQAFSPPSYPQLWGEFVPGLSVLDWWMNSGDSRTECREWL